MLPMQKRIIRMHAQSTDLRQPDFILSRRRRYTADQLERSAQPMVRPTVVRGLLIGAAASIALIAQPAAAQWKWRDGAGHVQYSDLPPPSSTSDKDILGRPSQHKNGSPMTAVALPASAASAASAASGQLASRTVEPELEAKRKKAEAEQAAKAKVEDERIAAARADNCSRAKNQLKTLESGIRLARTNEKGEREILDDPARAAESKRSRDVMASDCR